MSAESWAGALKVGAGIYAALGLVFGVAFLVRGGRYLSWQTRPPLAEPGADAPGAGITAALEVGVQTREHRPCDPTVDVCCAMAAAARLTCARGAIEGSGTARDAVVRRCAGAAVGRLAGATSAASAGGWCTPSGWPPIAADGRRAHRK